jgi:antirestriction protein ArdC
MAATAEQTKRAIFSAPSRASRAVEFLHGLQPPEQ